MGIIDVKRLTEPGMDSAFFYFYYVVDERDGVAWRCCCTLSELHHESAPLSSRVETASEYAREECAPLLQTPYLTNKWPVTSFSVGALITL